MSFSDLVTAIFIIANPIGNTPAILAQVKELPLQRQRIIVLRETLIALLLAIFFQLVGKSTLGFLGIESYAISITGGVLLAFVAFHMMFPSERATKVKSADEPFIVPIATPILAGPGLLTVVMWLSQATPPLRLLSALLLAWVGVFAIVCTGPTLLRLLGKRGLVALERIMGLVLIFLGVEMVVKGIALFTQAVQT